MKPEMTLDEARLVVKNIIYEVNGTPIHKINLEDGLIADLGMDSVELIDFIIRLEEFGVILSESQLSTSLTVEQISRIVVS